MPNKSLEDATSVIPEIIAGQLTRDADEIEYLVGRSHVAWEHSNTFRKTMTSARYDSRAQLKVWMEHWLTAQRAGVAGR